MAGSVTWRCARPPPRRIVLCPPDIPIERKSCLVIPRLQHVRSLTPRAAAAVSRTDRRLTCTGTYVVTCRSHIHNSVRTHVPSRTRGVPLLLLRTISQPCGCKRIRTSPHAKVPCGRTALG